ncbi:hypothetical protein BVC80_8869g27 [Macleaya cordata]|uniref:Uncharacterized protein n=1 Tax=Macleaya cordata TaxID=56857 RepID=A0A200Q736_MACCD|nr:hypothetical protein BVC80_8869g27 [Macleaya cordata]
MPTTTSPGDQIKVEEEEDDEDGFRTPTSLDHKIKVNYQQCPPAPKKPKSKSLPASCRSKRKASSRIIRIDLSKELHDLLQVPYQDVVGDLGSKIIKKVRSN